MPVLRHGQNPRVVALLAAACLLASLVTALLLTTGSAPDRVTLRALSATDVLALSRTGSHLPTERIVVLGDSVATGAGCDCQAFGPRLARLRTGDSDRPTRVSTLARDGITTADLLQQVQGDAATRQKLKGSHAVIVTIAANDFDPSEAVAGCAGTGTACYDAGLAALPVTLRALLSEIRAVAGAQARVLVTGYWNVFLDGIVGAAQGRTYQQTSDTLTRQVNHLLENAARVMTATYVDLYAAFHADGDTDDTLLLAADGDHPSAAGQQRIAVVLARSLARG
ncbi:MAG: ypmR-like uncharacterized protein [Frankiales bacterium]|jgi:lysophospholipase L1-like esterase|nr:ypmR-like uncharacterized protein [Frankiales bacterium]